MAQRNAVGIFALDPGVTSGCATGLIDLRMPTVAAAMRRARSKGNLRSWEVGGDHVSQAWEVMATFADWRFKTCVEKGYVAEGRFYFVTENFIPRQIDFEVASLLIIGGIESLIMGVIPKPRSGPPKLDGGNQYVWYDKQEPGQRWADDDWLKENGLWVPSVHERDARRHLAGKINKLL